MKRFTFSLLFLSIAPLFVHAATLRDFAQTALGVVYYLMQTIFALVGFGIIYTVFRYINAVRSGDKDAARFRQILIWAIIGLAVAFSLWGIVTLLANTLGWTNIGIPQFVAPTT